MILSRLLEGVKKGFYVDVGAHHPMRFSNTYYFYKRGWSGINIDATPGSMAAFEKFRPRDVNLELAIGELGQERRFFLFDEPAFNSFNESRSREHDGSRSTIRKEVVQRTRSLREILHERLPADVAINFLSVDVEGMDLEVLQSNDWERFRPRIICVESIGKTVSELNGDAVYRFLSERGYELYAKTANTLIFRECARNGRN